MLNRVMNLLKQRPFLRHVSYSMFGSGLSQVILLLGTLLPLMALYSPEQFGIYAIFMSVSIIAATLSTGRYELVIPIPAADREGASIFFVSSFLSLVMSILVAVVLWFWIPAWFSDLGNWAWLLPGQVFLIGFGESQRQWSARKQRFGWLAIAEIARATVIIATSWLAADQFGTTAAGLIIGLFAGWLAFSLVLLPTTLQQIPWSDMSTRHARGMAWSHRRNLFMLPSQGLNRIASNTPIFLLEAYFGSGVAGGYAVASRFLYGPQAMISEAMRTVFFPTASRLFKEQGQCRKLFADVLRFMVIISILMFIPMSLLAPWFISLVSSAMGESPEKWIVAGHVIQVLAPFYILQLMNGPVAGMWVVAGRQNMDLVWQACFLAGIILGLSLGLLTGGYTGSLIGYGSVKAVAFSVNIYFCWQFARGRLVHPSSRIDSTSKSLC